MVRGLAQTGELWSETMVFAEKMRDTPSRRMDESGVVWSKIDESAKCADAIQRDGRCGCRCGMSHQLRPLLAEFAAAGLEVMEWSVHPPSSPGEAGDFRARFGRSPAL